MPNLKSGKGYYASRHDCFGVPTHQANGQGGRLSEDSGKSTYAPDPKPVKAPKKGTRK